MFPSLVFLMGLTTSEFTVLAAILFVGVIGVVLSLLPLCTRRAPTRSPSAHEIEAAEQRIIPFATIIHVDHFVPGYVRLLLLTRFDGTIECVTSDDPNRQIEYGMIVNGAKLARIGMLRRSEYDWWLYGWDTLR